MNGTGPDAVILAAGMSRRAQTCKMEFEIGGRPMLSHVVDMFSGICTNIIVVYGHYKKKVLDILPQRETVIPVENIRYKEGMFSSVRKGVEFTERDFFICPGDLPGIAPETVEALASAPGNIRIPVYMGRKGHPVFFSKGMKEGILSMNRKATLRDFIESQEYALIDVNDRCILEDIDSAEDYKKFIRIHLSGQSTGGT